MDEHATFRLSDGHWLIAMAVRLAILWSIWLVLAQGSLYLWWFGLAVCLVAALVSLKQIPPTPYWLRPIPTLRFLPFFVWQVIHGGIDVGRRVVQPTISIEPIFVDYRFRVAPGPARLCLVCVVSLLPGTVACRQHGDTLTIHVLDRSMKVDDVLEQLERYTAAMFAAPLHPGDDDD